MENYEQENGRIIGGKEERPREGKIKGDRSEASGRLETKEE